MKETINLFIGLCSKALQWLLITWCVVGFATCAIWLRLNFFGAADFKVLTPSYPQQVLVTPEELDTIMIDRQVAANQGQPKRTPKGG